MRMTWWRSEGVVGDGGGGMVLGVRMLTEFLNEMFCCKRYRYIVEALWLMDAGP